MTLFKVETEADESGSMRHLAYVEAPTEHDAVCTVITLGAMPYYSYRVTSVTKTTNSPSHKRNAEREYLITAGSRGSGKYTIKKRSDAERERLDAAKKRARELRQMISEMPDDEKILIKEMLS